MPPSSNSIAQEGLTANRLRVDLARGRLAPQAEKVINGCNDSTEANCHSTPVPAAEFVDACFRRAGGSARRLQPMEAGARHQCGHPGREPDTVARIQSGTDSLRSAR